MVYIDPRKLDARRRWAQDALGARGARVIGRETEGPYNCTMALQCADGMILAFVPFGTRRGRISTPVVGARFYQEVEHFPEIRA